MLRRPAVVRHVVPGKTAGHWRDRR